MTTSPVTSTTSAAAPRFHSMPGSKFPTFPDKYILKGSPDGTNNFQSYSWFLQCYSWFLQPSIKAYNPSLWQNNGPTDEFSHSILVSTVYDSLHDSTVTTTTTSTELWCYLKGLFAGSLPQSRVTTLQVALSEMISSPDAYKNEQNFILIKTNIIHAFGQEPINMEEVLKLIYISRTHDNFKVQKEAALTAFSNKDTLWFEKYLKAEIQAQQSRTSNEAQRTPLAHALQANSSCAHNFKNKGNPDYFC